MKHITSPTLLVDKAKVLSNIEMMVKKARTSRVRLRPHFKTHQSKEIGSWFREFGVDSITVSSMKMAQYFANNNWKDITVAFPINPREFELINNVASASKLNLIAVNIEAVELLEKQLTQSIEIFIKIDTGYGRTGISPNDSTTINAILGFIRQSTLLNFKGFLCHAGHSYNATSIEEIENIYKDSLQQLTKLKETYKKDWPNLEVSVGDTPTCSVINDFSGVTEIRPGNFAFYDLFQHNLGVCNSNQIAVAMACPVVAKHIEKKTIIIHGGAIHFSKDRLTKNDQPYFGKVVRLTENGWSSPLENILLVSVSQEHGTLKVENEELFNEIKVGQLIGVLPIHSCLTANLMAEYITIFGDKVDHLNGI